MRMLRSAKAPSPKVMCGACAEHAGASQGEWPVSQNLKPVLVAPMDPLFFAQ
jgi:hypothetical protein